MMNVITIVFAICFLACWLAVLRYDIQMFQQNSYKPERFVNWAKEHILGHWRWWLLILCGLVWNKYLALVAAAVMLVYAYKEFKTSYKIKIVYTARVIRLYAATMIIGAALLFAVYKLFGPYAFFYAALLVLVLGKPMVLLGNLVNSPLEKAISKWYYKDAARKLAKCPDLVIIGITGSYGKTSTKNYLYRILSEKYNTLITPGNFNTTLGVVRTIREKLQPYHQVFIVEMGAKQVGDIKEICDLVHPTIGIVTSVGEMHLETFKTLENIQSTKFELIRSLPQDGLGVINADSPGIASYKDLPDNCQLLHYGIASGLLDYRAEEISYTPSGTDFTVVHGGQRMRVHTSLMGECNVLDILAGVAVADRLGVSESQQKIAIAKLQQVEHRLFISQKGGLTILDDAYNSNPEGARMALDVLRGLNLAEGATRIVVTPGFVELGKKQEEACRELGRRIAAAADKLIIVNKLNQKAIYKGAIDGGMAKENIICAQNLAEAAAEIRRLAVAGDAILYENDLPDTFK
jgi:UDP-N-acetylmuramoyl-tripeptide--D-alanyl-D-alanine ligase